MKATMVALKEFVYKKPCMGNIYIIMKALRLHLIALCNAPFNMLGHLMDPLQIALTKRHDMIFS
jgi:hypothetical protein